VNLVAKSLIREFDTKKQDADKALAESGNTGLEELSMEIEEDEGTDDGDTAEDNDDGFVDEVELLDDRERFALEKDIQPVKLALVKVSAKRKHSPLISICTPVAETCIQNHPFDYDCPSCLA
jgi:hypothetical protein